jgi:hypothetical protein
MVTKFPEKEIFLFFRHHQKEFFVFIQPGAVFSHFKTLRNNGQSLNLQRNRNLQDVQTERDLMDQPGGIPVKELVFAK